MGSEKRLTVVGLVAMLAILLTGCGATGPSHASLSASAAKSSIASASATPLPPTSLDVLRYNSLAQFRVAPFEARSVDTAKVQKLYAAILTAPPPEHIDWCPADIGADYQLTFTAGAAIVLQVQMLEGCRRLVLSNPTGCRAWDDTFVAELAATLGIPVSSLPTGGNLINTAGPNGPFAPQVPTPPLLTPSHC